MFCSRMHLLLETLVCVLCARSVRVRAAAGGVVRDAAGGAEPRAAAPREHVERAALDGARGRAALRGPARRTQQGLLLLSPTFTLTLTPYITFRCTSTSLAKNACYLHLHLHLTCPQLSAALSVFDRRSSIADRRPDRSSTDWS